MPARLAAGVVNAGGHDIHQGQPELVVEAIARHQPRPQR
jgi:hypothetical protein